MARRRTNVTDNTFITFKFLKAGAFSISGYGNFWPELTMKFRQIPGYVGNYAEHGYDFEKVYAIKLPGERPRPLPVELSSSTEETVRTAFQIRQAEKAADEHAKNNIVRDELYYHEQTGLIFILSDSFLDDGPTPVEDIPVAPEPAVTTFVSEDVNTETEISPGPRRRGRPPLPKAA